MRNFFREKTRWGMRRGMSWNVCTKGGKVITVYTTGLKEASLFVDLKGKKSNSFNGNLKELRRTRRRSWLTEKVSENIG